jgi:cell division protein FtsI (penicillin-binding protein 3)
MVRDVRNFGTIDLTTVMTKSSNVGISKLTLSLPPNNLYETLSQFGFGQRTHSGLAGENTGYISDAGYKNPFALATLSFGYGLVATPLQLAQAYAVLAAGGIKKPLSMIKPDANQALTAERIMPEAVAQIVTRILSATTQLGGTAFRARIPGYDIAAKTGTIRKVTQSGYQKDQHVALFAGFAPVQAPRVAMVVVIDEPQNGQFYGGQVAAPVFTHVMSRTLSMLNVVPNNSSSAAKLLVEQ